MRLRDEITEFCHVLFSQWLPPFFSQFFIEYPCLSKLKHWSSQRIWKSLVLHIYFSSCPESLGHPTRFQDCISLCIKAELTVLTTYPANLSVLSVGWFRGFGGCFFVVFFSFWSDVLYSFSDQKIEFSSRFPSWWFEILNTWSGF